MRYVKACATLLVLTQAFPAGAQPHLAPANTVDARLAAARAQRARDLAALSRLLRTDSARGEMTRLRLDPEAVSERLAVLDDREIHDLADRARRLDADPAAGESATVVAGSYLQIGLTLLLLYCLFQAISLVTWCSNDGCPD
jgi:hypothetical protein